MDSLVFYTGLFGEQVWDGSQRGRGPESCQKHWESWREGFLCCSNTGVCFSRVSHWKCLRHFVLESWLLTRVPLKSEVSINLFIHSQPATSVLTECSGEEERVE